ncbi:hypothetical protein L0P88_14615 [Muricauda sp. SCSIO 64092]|uniref:hypothetical protein n=1 Tax=Allomuricauda sp. SCSIO 64092 TaxID=2908842 RepID=UPI001FF227CE|nr:hypothetical protein [Muricauda sp. SCSIO 64092]UOY05175.1 hypothetical protein L0P88_14615 [Muricauda sp. SCSIO 64092]
MKTIILAFSLCFLSFLNAQLLVPENSIRFSEDRGFDYDPNTDAVYFNDFNNGKVITFGVGGNIYNNGTLSSLGTIWAIGNKIRFSEDRGFDYDPNKDAVYFNDFNNGRVITFGIGGSITNNGTLSSLGTIWAMGNKIRFSEDRGFDYDPNTDAVYFNDYNIGKVVTFARGGRVGIGTTDPKQMLSIQSTRPKFVLTDNDGDAGVIEFYELTNQLRFQKWLNSGSTYDKTIMVLDGDYGNVGIGTLTPDARLAVNGDIHAKEVKVDLVGWPDYVFDKDYELPTLEDVETHIKEKGHLQDIPSAQKVAENGIKLGEMNAKLLQKIEELMLYTIAQQKEIQKLKEEVKLLREGQK